MGQVCNCISLVDKPRESYDDSNRENKPTEINDKSSQKEDKLKETSDKGTQKENKTSQKYDKGIQKENKIRKKKNNDNKSEKDKSILKILNDTPTTQKIPKFEIYHKETYCKVTKILDGDTFEALFLLPIIYDKDRGCYILNDSSSSQFSSTQYSSAGSKATNSERKKQKEEKDSKKEEEKDSKEEKLHKTTENKIKYLMITQSVRCHGYDAAEKKDEKGPAATNKFTELVENCDYIVYCVIPKKKDKYKRFLADVFDNEEKKISFTDEMLKYKHPKLGRVAVEYYGGKKEKV